MTNDVDFDALNLKSIESNGAMEDLSNLFGNAFALPEWQFIARGELPNVTPYIASNADYAGEQPMIRAFTDSKRLIRFAEENNLTKPDGSCDSLSIPTASIVEYLEQFIPQDIHGIWFNSDTESKGFFIPLKQLRPIKEHLAKIHWQPGDAPRAPAQPPQTKLEDWGLTGTPDGGMDINLTTNQRGTVSFDTSIVPFYQAIVPLLENYQGSGEYVTLLHFEPSGMSEMIENFAANAHGTYLQVRRFLYLNPKNNLQIGVNSINSNHLRHIQSHSNLVVSLELCKIPANQTALFHFAFQGAGGEVKKLVNAIQPLLAQSSYQAA